MQSEPKLVTVAEIAADIPNAIAAGPFGSNLVSRDYVESGIPVIRGQNLAGRWVGGEFVYVSETKAEQLRTNTARPGDIVFTQRGTLGQVSIVPKNTYPLYVVSQSQMKLTVDTQKADPRFIYYACTAMGFVVQVHNNAVAAGVPHINLGILRSLRLPLPARDTQSQIADLLSFIDDRIDLLRQANATLESIAQALFKSWFIDFDPIRAKAEGREPEGMDAETAALFPDSFEDSALGEIPKGWNCARLSDLLELLYGKALKATERHRGPIPVYGSGGVTGFHNVSLVPHGSVIVGRKGTVGSLYWEDGPFYPIDTTFYVRPKNVPLTYCYYAMQRLRLETMNTDAAVPGLNRDNAYRLELIRPTEEIMRMFDGFATSLRDAMSLNNTREKTLSDIRDALLPRLISGKLCLPEAEAQLNEAIA